MAVIFSLAAAVAIGWAGPAGAALTWDANGTGDGQADGGGAWIGTGTNLWWTGPGNQDWFSGSDANFGNGGVGFAGMYSANNQNHTVTLNTATANDYAGNTTITALDYSGTRTGTKTTLKLGASNQIPNGTGKGNVVFNGADVNHIAILELNGFNETINGVTNIAAAGAIIRNTSTGATLDLDFGTGWLNVTTGLTTLPGDTNDDGVVDAADFITLKKNFNKAGAGVSQGNFTGEDGAVNWSDLGILMSNMGTGGGAPATAPEPCSAMLLMFGAAALLRKRRG
jgi:hypothetical protein